MPVEINITKKIYDFIDPSTGAKIPEEEFAKKHPGLAVGGHVVGSGKQGTNQEGAGTNEA